MNTLTVESTAPTPTIPLRSPALKLNTLYLGDMHQLITKIADNSLDLIICDGPYGGKHYDWDRPVAGIQAFNFELIQLFASKLQPGGTLYLFGKADCIDFIDYRPYLTLKSKIVWYQPSRLAQGKTTYTNNYDIICYFTKGNRAKTFNLDNIRIPQLVDLAQRKRCENVPSVRTGKWAKTKFNEKGKNPGNVWGDIKQLTYKSRELVDRKALNTLQKPRALIERLVLASSHPGDVVLDPFVGVGTTAVVCTQHKRNFIAFEKNSAYINISQQRILNER